MNGREALNQLIDAYCEFRQENGRRPANLKLGVLFAHDLAKLTRRDIGFLSQRVLIEGVKVFEETGLLGCKVQLVRNGSSGLQFE